MNSIRGVSELSTIQLGDLGEEIASDYLTRLGYTVLERNWRCPRGELDLIVRNGETFVAVEVKTRRGTKYGAPLEAIGYRKTRRLRALLSLWAREHSPVRGRLRIDAIGVTIRPGSLPLIEHVEGIS